MPVHSLNNVQLVSIAQLSVVTFTIKGTQYAVGATLKEGTCDGCVDKLGDSDGENVGVVLAVGLTEGSRDGAALIELISLELGLDDGTSDNLGDSDGTVVIILMLILMNKSSVAQSKSSSTEGASERLGIIDGGSDG